MPMTPNGFPVMLTFDLDADIGCLVSTQLGQFRTDLVQMQARDFFVQLFGKGVHADFIFFVVQFDLCQHLIGE